MENNSSIKKILPTTIFVIVFGLLLAGFVWIAKPNSDSASDQELAVATSLEADEQTYDFGEITMADGKTTHEFHVTNTSSEAVTINGMYTSCMCTEAELHHLEEVHGPFGMPGHGAMPHLEEKIDSGEEFIVNAIYDPNAHGPAGVGPVDRSVYVETSNGEQLELQFLAVVKP